MTLRTRHAKRNRIHHSILSISQHAQHFCTIGIFRCFNCIFQVDIRTNLLRKIAQK